MTLRSACHYLKGGATPQNHDGLITSRSTGEGDVVVGIPDNLPEPAHPYLGNRPPAVKLFLGANWASQSVRTSLR